MNDEHVILIIGDQKFYLSTQEAFDIARILNGATRIKSEWITRASTSKPVYAKPELGVASISPMPGPLQLELEANTIERDSK